MKTSHDAHHDDEPKKPTTAAPKPKPHDPAKVITITDKGFDPHDFAAKVGEPVKWVNESGDPVTVEFDTGGVAGSVSPPSSPELAYGATHEYTFVVPGGYKYHAKGDTKKTGIVTVK